jgi:cytochrome oxidase Cu insertion factor (SCO1/SenC/PrrC family)
MLMFSGYVFSQNHESGRCMANNQKVLKIIKARDMIGDFTITDSNGNTWNLYQQLGQGKAVFIDLFFTT